MTIVYCKKCKQDTIPNLDGRCSFCDTKLDSDTPASLTVLPLRNLATLSETVRLQHSLARAAAGEVVKHAVLAGAALLEAKGQLEHGQWFPWIAEHTDVSTTTAQIYMRLATYQDALGEAPTIRAAIETVKGYAPATAKKPPRAWLADAQRLRGAGMSYGEIAALLERSTMAVYKALNPKYDAAAAERTKAWRQRSLAERKAERDVERVRKLAQRLVDELVAINEDDIGGDAVVEALGLARQITAVLGARAVVAA